MKKIFLLLLSIAGFLRLPAQSTDSRILKAGMKLGMNYSLMNFHKGGSPPLLPLKNVWKPGLNVGFVLQFPLNTYLTFQPEYAYILMRGEEDRIKASYDLSYISLPVLLKISLTERFALIAGPEFALLIEAKEKTTGSAANVTHDTEERNISGVFGLEVKITRSIYLEARYLQSLNHIGLGQRSSIREFKWESICTGVGIRF